MIYSLPLYNQTMSASCNSRMAMGYHIKRFTHQFLFKITSTIKCFQFDAKGSSNESRHKFQVHMMSMVVKKRVYDT
jgi:hypothetical protein